ncbi:hypothetical protein CI109_100579 [Kwoniella shandongensis]|uniref:Uncharacterized protein n=1 Tax=Kwoniella shandongensis TaxID=1734106 RepID=A0A5M6C0W6_9TREE|nr:uncharacterized protein CI109_003499 [Kwoniella shandongensis]KAA5528210.1 hypothetical protein CI109_003499 [Kwoniella shandongensis]
MQSEQSAATVQTAGASAVSSHDNAGPDGDSSTLLTAELSTINSQLITHGWAKRPLRLQALSEKDYNEVVGVLFELLGASVSNLNTLDTLAGRHRTLQYECERLQKTNVNLKSTTVKLESDTAGWKARCTEVERRLHLEEAKTKELREEVGRGRKALEGVRVAAGHENKKIQMKMDKSLAQLAKISNDQTIMAKPQGLMLLNPIPSGGIQPVAATQSPLLEQTLRDLSDIRESLQEETEAFRHVVVSTGNGLREALAAAQGQDAPPRLMHSQFFSTVNVSTRQLGSSHTNTYHSASSTSHPSLANARLQSLIAEVRAKITEGVPKVVAGATNETHQPTPEEVEEQKRVEREQEKRQRDLEDRVKDLEVEVICAQAREEEAKKLVEEMSRLQMEQRMSRAAELEEEVDDNVVQHTLHKQRKAFEDERRRLAEETVRLSHEQQRFEAERQTFLEERRRADEAAVLAFIPPTPPDANLISRPASEDDHSSNEPGPSNLAWHKHLPHSPSPLSPLQPPKARTPKHHTAGGRRKSMKTPLSRLVLEKAVRQKGREGGAVHEKERPSAGSVLGAEGGRRTNAASPSKKGKERVDGLKTSTLSKSRSSGGSATSSLSSSKGATPAPSGALRATTTTGMRSSTSSALGASQRKVDLSKADGLGPKAAAKGARIWR